MTMQLRNDYLKRAAEVRNSNPSLYMTYLNLAAQADRQQKVLLTPEVIAYYHDLAKSFAIVNKDADERLFGGK